MKKYFLLICIFSFLPLLSAEEAADEEDQAVISDEEMLAFFSDPSRIWGNGVERCIEEAYRLCFNTRILGGKIMNLRMPFAQDNERNILTSEEWGFLGGGKGNPSFLWDKINEILDSEDFALYTETLSDGNEKVIIFDLPAQAWTVTRDLFDIARMKAGSYRGLPHKPYVLVSGRGLEESDVYNYLYCIALAGMDCSGFVWHVLSYVSAAGGTDLGRSFSRLLGIRQGGDASRYAGTAFYNTRSHLIQAVRDEIAELKPCDIILFRSSSGGVSHSAVIQSVDFSRGVIRYLQSTDEAPLLERGVHESFIYFDPEYPHTSLKDPSLLWSQKRYPPFPGEKAGPFSDDGIRYRAYPEYGGGRIVRLRPVTDAIQKIN